MGYADQNGGQPSSFKIRLMIAIGFILMGLFSYWSHEETNPVTGKQEHLTLTPNEEIRLGLQSSPEMIQKMGGEALANNQQAQEVKRIGELIISKTAIKNSPWKFKFHLLADKKTINAFALPGGQVFITTGLLNKLHTEAQLAGVLSHEMGHVIERHTAKQMAKSDLGQVFVQAVGVGAGNNMSSMQNSQAVASLVNHMMQLKFNRHDESEADIWGLVLMMESGYDPKAMIQVLEILKAEEGRGETLEIFETHPHPEKRIIQIESYLKEHPPAQGLSEGGNLHDLFTYSSVNY
jgi:beta-barrel assembly-enhancing protease